MDSVVIACQRSEEHTSELQSQSNLVCRLLLDKKLPHKFLRPHYQVQPLFQHRQRLLRRESMQKKQTEIHLIRLATAGMQRIPEKSKEALSLARCYRR